MNPYRQIACVILLLFCSVVSCRAQIVFEATDWDFGTIRETDGRVTHTFTGTNRGKKPAVILDVVSSCGCTASEFSRKPIPAGAETRITVTYDPANRPGTFERPLAIYASDRKKIATLTVRGKVIPREKTIEERYPVDAGGGLRLAQTLCALSYIRQGGTAQSAIGIVNTSNEPISLELHFLRSSGVLMSDCPAVLAPGERREINFAYRLPAAAPRYGTLHDAAEIRVDGATNGTIVSVHGIGIDPPPARNEPRAVAELSENFLKFGIVGHDAAPLRKGFSLRNTGETELIVRAVEHDDRIRTTLGTGRRIAPGGSVEAEVEIDPRQLDYGTMSSHIVLITNDAERPMRRLRVTAIVEDRQ